MDPFLQTVIGCHQMLKDICSKLEIPYSDDFDQEKVVEAYGSLHAKSCHCSNIPTTTSSDFLDTMSTKQSFNPPQIIVPKSTAAAAHNPSPSGLSSFIHYKKKGHGKGLLKGYTPDYKLVKDVVEVVAKEGASHVVGNSIKGATRAVISSSPEIQAMIQAVADKDVVLQGPQIDAYGTVEAFVCLRAANKISRKRREHSAGLSEDEPPTGVPHTHTHSHSHSAAGTVAALPLSPIESLPNPSDSAAPLSMEGKLLPSPRDSNLGPVFNQDTYPAKRQKTEPREVPSDLQYISSQAPASIGVNACAMLGACVESSSAASHGPIEEGSFSLALMGRAFPSLTASADSPPPQHPPPSESRQIYL